MVYTLTFNPALDYAVVLEDFNEGGLNRSKEEYINYGGKGINVSVVLNNLSVENTALGFLAGFTGRELEKHLKEQGINTDFIYLKSGLTRINVKIKGENETEINASGPDIDNQSLNLLYEKLEQIKTGDFLILSGSIPKSLPQNTYSDVLKRLCNKGIEFVVDAEKQLLIKTLSFRPFLVKPNLFELEQIAGKTLENYEQIADAAKELIEKGAKNVLVSMGDKGAMLVCEDMKVYKQKAPIGKAVNTVGAGDSMIAGFLKGYLEENDCASAIKYAVCAGSATAFSKDLATAEKIYKILEKIN